MNINDTKRLLNSLSKGDTYAFRVIYEQYWEKLYTVCYYYTNSREDAEDLVAEIFISLWKNRTKIEINHLSSYLVKAAKNKSLKYLQKQQRQRKYTKLFKEKVLSDDHCALSPDHLLEIKELSLALNAQIQSLPAKTQKIFLLNRDRGLTYEQISKTLNVSVKTVEYHISKALKLLSTPAVILILVFFLDKL